jgi:hypothetical protein
MAGGGVVHIPWYATGFRGDGLQEALEEITPVAGRYGATSWAVYRYRDDRYKFLQVAEFAEKLDFDRYWNGQEFKDFRVIHSSWYQIPVVYAWTDLCAGGRIDGAVEESAADVPAHDSVA